jgi:hypothetical protein
MGETFQWGKTLLWIAGNFRPPNMDLASVLYSVAAARFKRSWRIQARGTPSTHKSDFKHLKFSRHAPSLVGGTPHIIRLSKSGFLGEKLFLQWTNYFVEHDQRRA